MMKKVAVLMVPLTFLGVCLAQGGAASAAAPIAEVSGMAWSLWARLSPLALRRLALISPKPLSVVRVPERSPNVHKLLGKSLSTWLFLKRSLFSAL